ncbi:MAG: hypothetical protein ACPL3C_05805 [Pyrobaculum sp.]
MISVASSSAALAYWLERNFTELNAKMRELDARLENLSNALIQFSEILTLTLETKDIFTATEALHLKNVVRSLLPAPRSRYYTWEIYEKPKNILDKDLEEYTIADTEEMNRIADLMEKEGREEGACGVLLEVEVLRYGG